MPNMESSPVSSGKATPPLPTTTAPVPTAPSATTLPRTGLQTQISSTIVAALATALCPGMSHPPPGPRSRELGFEVKLLHPSMFLYQNWNSYWLRWIAHGKEAYFLVARTEPEMVLVGEILAQLRTHNVDIDAAAINLAVQTQNTQAKNIATKALAQHLVAELQKPVPVQTDTESHDRIRELETHLGVLQQKLQQKEAAASSARDPTHSPKTPAGQTSGVPRSPLGSAEPASAKAPAATLGQPLRQLPLSFSPNNPGPIPAAPQPDCILKPPHRGLRAEAVGYLG